MSASPTSYRARGPGMLIEMARRGIYARQTIVPLPPSAAEPVILHRRQRTSSSDNTLVEAAGFDFTPPQHVTASSSDFDNAPPEMTHPHIKGAFFGLPYAQRYNSQNRSETTVHDQPLASLHVAPATIGYKAAQCAPTRRAGRIQLSLRHTPKLGRAAIKVADFFQARGRNASDRHSTEPSTAFGNDSVKRYSQRLSGWQMAGEEHGCRLNPEFRHTQVPARSVIALQVALEDLNERDDKLQDSSTRRARNSIGSTSSVKRSSRVLEILRIATPPQLHRPQLVTIKRSSDKYEIMPSSL
ncbi:hypothetical protein GGI19_000690 [Coemansia pectinata]|uniref:Uncharacterized protein n=1 Tax=Coemansia pectinata TaxID=1052879 RepID=A0A9W8H3J5_9FUNG|nr:hypothetical protein GGI19_000690 [Coemansia pectinata]